MVPPNVRDFKGVFMKDALPSKSEAGASYIINLDDSEGPGTHWMGLYVAPKEAFYYDPYGLDPPREVRKFAQGVGRRPVRVNRHKHQHVASQHCGRYVLQFLKAMNAPGDPGENFEKFTTKTFIPDDSGHNNKKIRRIYGLK